MPANSLVENIDVLLKCIMPELRVSFKKCILFFKRSQRLFTSQVADIPNLLDVFILKIF